MSRIGRMPIASPAGVTVTIAEDNKVTVKGPKGTLERVLPAEMTIKEEDGHIVVTTQRFKEDEILTWSYENTGCQHDPRRDRGL